MQREFRNKARKGERKRVESFRLLLGFHLHSAEVLFDTSEFLRSPAWSSAPEKAKKIGAKSDKSVFLRLNLLLLTSHFCTLICRSHLPVRTREKAFFVRVAARQRQTCQPRPSRPFLAAFTRKDPTTESGILISRTREYKEKKLIRIHARQRLDGERVGRDRKPRLLYAPTQAETIGMKGFFLPHDIAP